ncbi:MAG: alpha/beta fold hydrolase [Microcoleaceae cyanobacterium]
MYQPLHYAHIQLSQGHLFWRELGQGTTIVFLHGIGQDGSGWLSVAQDLSAQYHCLVVDLPGCGESDELTGHYSIHAVTEILAEYLRALKLQRVYLVGHSVGGWIAANYALKYLEQVQGLILLSPEGVQVPELKKHRQWVRSLVQSPSFSCLGLTLIHPLAILLGQGGKVNQWLQLRRELQRSGGTCKLLYKRRWAEYQAELLNERLPCLHRPILILQGSQEQAIACSQSQSYETLAPLTQRHIVQVEGQNLLIEAPEVVVEYIREFTLGVNDSQLRPNPDLNDFTVE